MKCEICKIKKVTTTYSYEKVDKNWYIQIIKINLCEQCKKEIIEANIL